MRIVQTAIEKEKYIADEILQRLEILDPTCILAGGAPRDWWLGRPANDLDFYIHCTRTTQSLEESLKYLGFTVTPRHVQARNVRSERLENLYNAMPDLRSVYETEFRGKKVQIMVMNQPTFLGVVERFAVSISKVWYKHGTIVVSQAAQASLRDKTILVEKNYGPHCNYIQKMRERFPDFLFIYQFQDTWIDSRLQVSYD